jgi:hypothetical protein
MRTFILYAILLAASAGTSNEASGIGEYAEACPSDQSRKLFRIGNAEEKEKVAIKLQKQDWH